LLASIPDGELQQILAEELGMKESDYELVAFTG
jgi:hypothetical protein